jgi:hypothetical protein
MRCLRCREDKDPSAFPWRDRRWNVRQTVCMACAGQPHTPSVPVNPHPPCDTGGMSRPEASAAPVESESGSAR